MSVNLNAFPFDSQITGYGADGLPEYDRASNSEEFASLIHGFWRDGVFGTSALTVIAGSGLTVTVGTGSVLIQGRVARITEAKTLTFDPSDSQQRFDRVVARCDLSNAVRDIVLDVVKGTPTSAPVAPTLTRNQSKWELCLATVRIPAGATSVQQANITDTRMDSVLCGLVAATMTDVDTSRFYDQVQGDLDDFRANEQKEINDFFDTSRKEFDSWLDEIQGALGENAAASIMSQLLQKAAAYSEVVVLYSDGWIESEDGFYQEVACGIASGKTSDSYVVSPTPSSIEAYTDCSAYAVAFGDGSVTFRAKAICKEDVSVNVLEIERGTQDGDVPNLQEQVLKNAAGIDDVKKDVDRISEEINDVNAKLDEDYVRLVHNNLFSQAEILQTGKYVSVSANHIVLGNNATYDSYIIPVDGISKYAFTKAYYALLLEEDKYTAVGGVITGATIIDSTGAAYIAFSLAPSINPPETYIVSKGTALIDEDSLPEIEPLPSMQAVINRVGNLVDGKTKYSSGSADSMTSGDSLVLPVETLTELKKKSKVVFEADITTFSKVDVGYTYNTTMASTSLFSVFEITENTVNYYQRYFSDELTETQNHGLTLNGNIQVVLEQTDTASCLLTIISDGEEYQHEFSTFELIRSGRPFVLSVGSTLANCKLTWTCGDFGKKIWMFGDSYFSYAPNRWPFFLHRHGYDDNVLLDGFPGEGSAGIRQSFGFLLNFATPMFAVMCTGMNDGTDSESAPSTTWVTQRDFFLQYCNENNVEPILSTIPSVPTINHEQKNAWVRSSGYRFIDFAKSVGATPSGVWFDGMLSADNVHPTEKGARALFARVLVDLPEIMIDN